MPTIPVRRLLTNSGCARISSTPGKQQPDPAAPRPGKQPRQPIPVRPALAPVGNGRADAHHFPDDKEPEHVPPGAARSKASADPCAKNRHNNEERSARDEGVVGGYMALHE